MSDVKAPRKGDAASKKPEATKTEVKSTEAKTPDAGKPEKATETASAETPAAKADAAPKSASQTSISHFSSVSTPAYRAGWEAIFGGAAARKTKSKASDGDDFPDSLVITDEDIDAELRAALYKAFQKKARSQGFSLAKAKKTADIAYNLDCHLIRK
ncbi:hypothetical protein [Bauldia litoralis]|uniref:Uncharacterized protein n=1 Tax=Bauldia litoralis TaxID=665467 RepID=A0A1G6E594_9HYPH|nr:hypothetical protein [Bauldia litoralis]SDB52654.1 hypothetical protein SAMN02982931_04144 [Bauldia litoralis]